MKKVKVRKIKDTRIPGNRRPKTEKFKKAASLRLTKRQLLNNPMKNPESRAKNKGIFKPRPEVFTKELVKLVLYKYTKEKKSMSLISKELGVSRGRTVLKILKENNIDIRSNQKKSIYKIEREVKT